MVRHYWAKAVLVSATPIGVSAAWIPVRDHLSNTDLALVLVLLIGVAGWSAGARGALGAAVCAAAAFDLLDTRPYGTLAISRTADATTALILLSTGLLIGVGAARLARYRSSEDRRVDALAVVMEASGLVATGGERQLVTEAVGAELIRGLNLLDCSFHARPPSGTRPAVARDGTLVGLMTNGPDRQIDLPIWSQGEVVAHYRLVLGPEHPTTAEMRVALGLADQVGAATVYGEDEDPPPEPSRHSRLRLMRDGDPAEPCPAPQPAPPAGGPGASTSKPAGAVAADL
jgi:hypothetical protein